MEYGMVGNCKTCALVKKDSSIEWMCFPTFSSPSIFAKIIDGKKGGFCKIVPKGKYTITQQYIPDTAILETIFASKDAAFKVVDFFPRYRKLLGKKKEQLYRQNRLVRLIKPLKGTPLIKVQYQPRPSYAKDVGEFREEDGNLLYITKQDQISLISNVAYENLNENYFELKHTKYLVIGAKDAAKDFSVRKCLHLFHATKHYWKRWVGTLILPEKNRETIIRSAITLKLLTYSPTGAIIAAATTSIPEEVGSVRTWDYRYCWVRDSVFAADALKKIGRDYEAKRLMEFIINRALEDQHLQIMYGIHGETQLEEKTLGHLDGYKGSKPVRIGNGAFDQKQFDIYGEIVDAMYLYFCYYEYEQRMTKRYWKFLTYIVKQIAQDWTKKDSGIWEFRGLKQHYVHSKFMCYIGVDRAIKIAQFYGRDDLARKWIDLREDIYHEIIRKGFNKKKNSFVMYYNSEALDASLLQMAYLDFLPGLDPRMKSTVQTIYNQLRQNDLVQRYKIEDDFGQSTSAFTICSFWLVDALYYIGEKAKAQKLYEKLSKRGNHLGLFSEDIDLKTKKLIGNFPQAYTHIALINTSILLSEWSVRRKKIDWSGRKEQLY